MFKKLISLVLALVLVPGMLTVMSAYKVSAKEVQARGETYSGKCGDNLTWTLDTSTGVLEISGSGAIKDYSYDDDAPWYSFAGYIKTIVIDNAVTSIGDYAFYYCKSLTSTMIPNSVTSIGEGAFSGCAALTSITIPNSVTSIGDYAFSGCTGFTSITIPDSVTNIGDWAFSWCSSLTSIAVADNNNNYSSQDGVLFNKDKTKLICCPEGKSGTYTIPNSVTSIDHMIFYNCTGLTSVTIPNSVTGIGNWAFSQCYSLTSITIPNSVTSIGKEAFSYCYSLTSIMIPSSVTSIGDRAFSGCTGLTSIAVADNNKNYSSHDGVLFNKDKTVLICCPAGKSGTYMIPTGVTSIGEGAFAQCDSQTSITIPSSVTSIGYNAFEGCNNLTIYGTAGSYAKQYANENDIAFVCVAPTSDYTAIAYYSDGTNMEDGTQLVINEIANAELPAIITGDTATAYDISITKDGKEITPTGNITVRMPLHDDNTQPKQGGATVTNYEVYSINSDKAELISSHIDGSYIVFTIKAFGRYAVKKTVTEVDTEDDKPTDSDVKQSDSDTKSTDSDVKQSDTDKSTESDYITITDSEDTSDDTPIDTETPTDTEAPTDSDAPGLMGDVNGDGEVNMEDVVMLQKCIAELVDLTDEQKNLADVTHDGDITMLDVITMQKYIAKLITEFSAKA